MSGPLSLGTLTLYLPITLTLITTPLSIAGTGGKMPSCIGLMVLTLSWGCRVCERNGVSLVVGLQWFCLADHVLQGHLWQVLYTQTGHDVASAQLV